jgi:hypothetical protein
MRVSSIVLLVVVLTLSIETSGWGYVRATVEGKPDVFLYWPSRNVPYLINHQGYSELPLDEVVGAMRRSFTAWSAPDCTDFSFTFGGLTDVNETNVTRTEREQPDYRNVVRWREDAWPPADATHAGIRADWLALTVLVYDTETGEIVDADMDLNGVNFRWTTTDARAERATDVQNVVTHEVGHVLGLGHTDVTEATMHARQPQGEISKRQLHGDDIEGLCSIYPFGRPTTLGATQPVPALQLVGRGGCELHGMGRASRWVVLALILLGLVALPRRWR